MTQAVQKEAKQKKLPSRDSYSYGCEMTRLVRLRNTGNNRPHPRGINKLHPQDKGNPSPPAPENCVIPAPHQKPLPSQAAANAITMIFKTTARRCPAIHKYG